MTFNGLKASFETAPVTQTAPGFPGGVVMDALLTPAARKAGFSARKPPAKRASPAGSTEPRAGSMIIGDLG
ncbi:hypothetical protein [Actinophytocola sp.]|uniref:hypothetical protein n=1 Tax=Actinophytocola sp. TaxID=1872138 RepID=UPI002ED20101